MIKGNLKIAEGYAKSAIKKLLEMNQLNAAIRQRAVLSCRSSVTRQITPGDICLATKDQGVQLVKHLVRRRPRWAIGNFGFRRTWVLSDLSFSLNIQWLPSTICSIPREGSHSSFSNLRLSSAGADWHSTARDGRNLFWRPAFYWKVS